MGRSRRPEGKCRLCGINGPLSWEHVPPEAAYNDHRVVRATQEQILKPELWDGRRGEISQRGSGGYTLCEPCNNNTGDWYAREYVRWAKQALDRLANIPSGEQLPFYVPFTGRPLRFLKQVVTMFFSVNSEKFADIHPELVKFVLDRSSRGLPPKYKVNLVLVRGGFVRSSGVSASINVASGTSDVASEIAHFPFALRLLFGDVNSLRMGPIEHFADFELDQKGEVWLYTEVGDVTTKFPGDYRSRERVDREAIVNADGGMEKDE